MATAVRVLVAVLGGYVCGALPFGLWLGRLRGIDVREHGSRNLGATNVYRVLGAPLGITTLLLDVLKGALPTWLLPSLPFFASFPGGKEGCAVTVGLAAVAGPVWTCLAAFIGGKGVATTVGVLLAVAPLACAVFAGVFVLTLGLTRYVSLGSILGSVAFVIALLWASAGRFDRPALWMGVLLAALVIARHKENLRRLARGEERRFAFRRGAAT